MIPSSKQNCQFFVTVAKILCPFWEEFQGERPKLPFMAECVPDILHTSLERFIKKSVMDKATSMAKLAKVDVSEKENLLPAKNVDIGFTTRKLSVMYRQTRKWVIDKSLSLRMIALYSYCYWPLSYLERCPLQYPVVRYLVCLDPRIMVRNPDQAIRKMTQLLEKVMTLKQRSADNYDTILW